VGRFRISGTPPYLVAASGAAGAAAIGAAAVVADAAAPVRAENSSRIKASLGLIA